MSGAAAGPAALWLEVSGEVVAGIHHALNNRVGALAAVAQVLEGEMEPGHPLRAALAQEVERLQATVRVLTWLPRRSAGSAEAVQLADVLPRAVELYHYHHDVRDTPCTLRGEGDVPPLRLEPALLAHVLLALLIDAGIAAKEAGTEVLVSCAGSVESVTVVVEAVGAGPEADVEGRAGRLEALEPWVRALGGTLREEAGHATLRLPTLMEVRRREREGSA